MSEIFIIKNTGKGVINSLAPENVVPIKSAGSSDGGVITEDSDTVIFTGNGTVGNPLSAESMGVQVIKNITQSQTTFAEDDVYPIGVNILNPQKIIPNKITYQGAYYDDINSNIFENIPIKGNTKYSFKDTYNLIWLDENKVLISYEVSNNTLTSPTNARFLTVDYTTNTVPEKLPMVQEGEFGTMFYEPFEGLSGTKIKNLFIDLLYKKGNSLIFGDSEINQFILNSGNVYLQDLLRQNFFGFGSNPNLQNTSVQFTANLALGHDALRDAKNNIACTAIGYNALKECDNGIDHTAFGAGAMEKQRGGVGNSAFGRLALANSVNGTNLTAYGDTALEFCTGNGSTAMGYSAGIKAIGDNNCHFGTYSGGHYLGRNAPDCTWENTNTFGAFCLQSNEDGERNNFFGTYGGHLIKGDDNAGFGDLVLRNAVDANRNTAFGNSAGLRLIDGNDNVFIGYNSGNVPEQVQYVNNSMALGVNSYTDKDNQIVIGNSTQLFVKILGVEFTKAQILALKNLVS